MIFKKWFDFAIGGRSALKVFYATATILLLSFNAYAQFASVGDFNWPENSLQVTYQEAATTKSRVFVTARNGFYEMIHNGTTWTRSEELSGISNCWFRGVSELNGYVYTFCVDNVKPHLFAFKKNEPVFLTEINLAGLGDALTQPNGMTSDGRGNLYIAEQSVAQLPVPGYIFRIAIDPANPLRATAVRNIYSFENCKPNGMKYAEETVDGVMHKFLYLTAIPMGYVGLNQLLRYDVDVAGGIVDGSRYPIFSTSYFLDDFILVRGGFILAEFTAGRVMHISDTGSVLHKLLPPTGPTSMTLLKWPSATAGALLVTNSNYDLTGTSGTVDFYDITDWSVIPR